jgi:RHS repeat-associated protein
MNSITTPSHDAYGQRSDSSSRSRIAFAGGLREADTGWYVLGGRLYSPTLRRFLAPDSISPFADGGINRYAYCGGDPINRVDPSGQSWRSWMGGCLGLNRPTGAAQAVSSASYSPYDAAVTPTMATAAAAAVVDAMSVTAAIGPAASMTQQTSNGSSLLGWVASPTATTSVQLPEARPGSSGDRPLGPMHQGAAARPRQSLIPRNPNVKLVTDPHIPAARLTTDSRGNPRVKPRWTSGRHVSNARSTITAADAAVSLNDVKKMLPALEFDGVTQLTLYSGAHGHPLGQNWYAGTGAYASPEPRFAMDDRKYTKVAGKAFGITIDVVDVGRMNRQDFIDRLSEDGQHFIGICFGLAFPAVMEALNVPTATVYMRLPPPPP